MKNKRCLKSKKAVSPIVATVLLVALAVSASAMIYAWSKSFIAEQLEKFGSPIETVCEKIKFNAQLSRAGGEYTLLVNNQANVDISQLNIKLHSGGRTIVKTFTPDNGNIPKAGTGSVTFALDSFGGDIASADTFDVIPLLLGRGKNTQTAKLHPCTDKILEGLTPK